MYHGKLNWIENSYSGTVSTTYNPTTAGKWAGNVAYKAAQKADGKYHLASKTVLQNGGTYGATPTLTRYINRAYSSKQKIGGKKNRQYFKDQTVVTLNGFLSGLKDTAFSGASAYDKDSMKWFCEGFPHTSAGKGTIPKPTSFSYSYEDIDIEGSGNDKQISSYGRNIGGYIVRNRIRINVPSFVIGWSWLSDAEVKNLISAVSGSQYLKVNYYDVALGINKDAIVFNSERTISSMAIGYQEVTLTFTGV